MQFDLSRAIARFCRVRFTMSFSVLLAVIAAGCASPYENVQAIDTKAIAAVQTEIKRQIGVYMLASRQKPTLSSGLTDADFACGNGSIGFAISSIKAELTTSLDRTTSVNAGIKAPIDIVTLGVTGKASETRTNSQTLTYNLWPIDFNAQPQDFRNSPIPVVDTIKTAPIAQVLLDLRDALILSALKKDHVSQMPLPVQPCLTDYDPGKPAADPGNSYKLALSITKSASGGVSVDVTVLSVGASGESKSVTGNTLTVSFSQTGLGELQGLLKNIAIDCKHPNETSTQCTQSNNALQAYVKAHPNDVGVTFQ